MAQAGYTPIQLYYSTTASQAPLVASLANGELAINITDGKLFYKDNAAAVQVIGWKLVPTSAGGTGLTSYTAGDILYYATGTALTKLAIGASNTVLTSSGSAPQWSTGLNNVTIGATTATTGKFTTIQASTNIGVGTATTVSGVFNVGGGRSFFGANSETYSLGVGYTQTRVNSGQTYYIGATDSATPALVFSNAAGTERLRLADAGDLSVVSGNVIQGTSAKGFNFTANTPLAGMTSQLLNWYEEGTWTPNQGAGLTVIGAFSSTGRYTRIGRQVTVTGTLTGATSVAVSAGGALFSNLPVNCNSIGFGVAMNAGGTVASLAFAATLTATSINAIAASVQIYFEFVYTT